MSQELAEALTRRFSERERTSTTVKGSEAPEWVFHNRRGSPFDDSRVRKHFQHLMPCGIADHPVYDLRHTFATLLLRRVPAWSYESEHHTSLVRTLVAERHCRYLDFLDTVSERDRHQIGTTDDLWN